MINWRRQILLALGGFALAAGIYWLLLAKSGLRLADFEAVVLGSGPMAPLAFAAASFAAMCFAVGKWRFLWRAKGHTPPSTAAMLGYQAFENFLSQILPKAIGPLIVKTWAMRRHGVSIRFGFGTALLDKLFDLLVTVCLLPGLLVLMRGGGNAQLCGAMLAGLAAGCAALLLGRGAVPPIVALAANLLRRQLAEEDEVFVARLSAPRPLLTLFGWAVGRVVLLASRIALLTWFLSVNVPFLAAGLLATTAQLAGALGLTPGGVGLYEGLFFTASHLADLAPADVMALLLAMRIFQYIATFLFAGLLAPAALRRVGGTPKG